MKMKEGEWIQDQGTRDIVINETGARELNIPSLTGRLILSDDEDSENSCSTHQNQRYFT